MPAKKTKATKDGKRETLAQLLIARIEDGKGNVDMGFPIPMHRNTY